ncbi:MAG TPA: hypothetical protein V7792_00230 [Candidatus Azoamicus sp. OHIO2]
MTNINIKYIIWIIIFFLIFILFNSWENEKTINKSLEKKYIIDNSADQINKNSTKIKKK